MSIDQAVFILRVVAGALMAGHGAQKLFGWFGGAGLEKTVEWVGSLGLKPARFWGTLVGVAEFGGGVLFLLGLFSPLGSLAILTSLLMAISRVHWPTLWVTEGGFEYPLVLATVVALVGLLGPGIFSLDAAWGTAISSLWSVIVLTFVLAGWILGLVVSRRRARA